MKKTAILITLLVTFFSLPYNNLVGQTTVKKVVLQAFWWDYWNSNYAGSWANYLTELAPRLKEMGIDAVWIPPIPKGNNGEGSVGYDVFDHYDLGDKYQKAHLNTRVGTKDELLRMIAVMHANGIEVIQDVVLNHVIGAGDLNGSLGEDPNAPGDKFKNFRYSSFATPAIYGLNDNYLSRSGRWPKNHQNFHPNTDHNCNSGEICEQLFGPDICYYSNAIGQSSNATFNPVQSTDYMRNEARSWVMWLKKQTGVDGFRWDATKHFPTWVQQDLSYNLKYTLPIWAKGNEGMFNVGEYVDFSSSGLDGYVNAVTTANGGSDFLMGAFDFSLRAGIKNMIDGNGFYNMSNLPGTQQNLRVAYYATPNLYVHRTVPFVNNHDTFRPQLDANGNYIGWNSGSELAPHIDPFNERLPLAYALIFAVDGAPQIFFEDLFDIGGTGMRYTHDPKSATELPTREPLAKIIKLHQQLNFKDGTYKVRSAETGTNGAFFPSGSGSADLLIIERSAKAIIALNDNGAALQEAWVNTDFPPTTVLIDHSGYVAGTSVVQNDGRALIKAPPVDPANGTYGFAIWGPQGTLPTYTPSRSTTTQQEWEMANDLGDSHCQSLKQGGALPDNSTEWRIAGKIFVAGGSQVSYNLIADASKDLTLEFVDISGIVASSTNGLGTLSGNFSATQTGWLVMRMRNTTLAQLGQNCFLNVSYTAPATITDVEAYPPYNTVATWSGASSSDWFDCTNWLEGNIPQDLSVVTIPVGTPQYPIIAEAVTINNLTIEPGAHVLIESTGSLNVDYVLVRADINAYGQLKVLGTLNVNNSFKHQQYVAQSGWHNLGASVAAPTTVSTFGTIGATAPSGTPYTINLYNWDAVHAEWVPITDPNTPLVNGAGYLGFVGRHGIMADPGILELEGTPITSVTPSIHYGPTSGTISPNLIGWNFIANPLAATLSFSTLTLNNVNNAFYIWDAQTESYKSWSGGGITDPYIAPTQGFWVQANSASSPDIGTIDYSKSVLSVSPLFLKTYNHLVLRAYSKADTSHRDELVFGFSPTATPGYDAETDAYKLWNISNTPNLYSVYENQRMAINTIPEIDGTNPTYLPVGFEAKESGTYTLKFKAEYLTQGGHVYVEDIALKHIHRLDKSPYTFTYNAREKRIFTIILTTIALPDNADKTIAFAANGGITVINQRPSAGVYSLFDSIGRLVAQGDLQEGENFIQANLRPGIYLLEHRTPEGTAVVKVVF